MKIKALNVIERHTAMQSMRWLIYNPRGSVLIIGLFTVAILALLGAAATSTSRTDVSISGNMKILQQSFYASEIGLTEGELVIDSWQSEFDFEETKIGYYERGKQNLSKMDWGTDSIKVPDSALLKSIFTAPDPPRYTIEKRDYIPDSLVLGKPPTGIYQYNITSQGTGKNLRTKTILRTVFAERFN